jgi:hypothetical protein
MLLSGHMYYNLEGDDVGWYSKRISAEAYARTAQGNDKK